jgi:hypothetical protein
VSGACGGEPVLWGAAPQACCGRSPSPCANFCALVQSILAKVRRPAAGRPRGQEGGCTLGAAAESGHGGRCARLAPPQTAAAPTCKVVARRHLRIVGGDQLARPAPLGVVICRQGAQAGGVRGARGGARAARADVTDCGGSNPILLSATDARAPMGPARAP